MKSNEAVVFSLEYTPPVPLKKWDAKKIDEWKNNRDFYSCRGENTAIKYILDDQKVVDIDGETMRADATRRLGIDLSNRLPSKSEAKNIAEYMTRFNTLGAFNLNGVMTQAELDEYRRMAQSTTACIYHGVISLSAKQSELVSYSDFQRLIKQTFGGFLKSAGFDPKNVAMLAAMHTNTENKHVHFCFFEKEPKHVRCDGRLGFRERYCVPQKLLDEYRMSATAFLDENKRDLYSFRNVVIGSLRSIGFSPSDKQLLTALKKLSAILPERGQLQYNADNIAPFRKDIDDVVKMLLRKNPRALSAHNEVLKEIARRGKNLAETGTKNDYAKRLTQEYKSRLGNVVLGYVRQYRKDARLCMRGEPQTRKQHKARARVMRSSGNGVIKQMLLAFNGGRRSVQANFTRDLRRAEREISLNTAGFEDDVEYNENNKQIIE